tara:strand:+ start:426 stop:2432 length:2007 start_codon:yes stop_codon:yes gene_type:complete
MPLLATCTYVGGAYLRRLMDKIDFHVQTLLILQDGDQQSVIDAVDKFVADARSTHSLYYVQNIRHVIDQRRLGSVGCFNAVIRLYPSHAFWPTIADDLYFEPHSLERFYKHLLSVQGSRGVGGVAAQIRRPERRYPGPPELDGVRPTFGCMAWANTRAGILAAGLYDENFYPHFYDDTDHIFRMYLADLTFYAVNGVIAFHGNASEAKTGSGRTTGNAAAELQHVLAGSDASSFSNQRKRSNTKAHFLFKWGRVEISSFSLDGTRFSFGGSPQVPVDTYKTWCARDEWRYCSPYNRSYPLWYWEFSDHRRSCTLNGQRMQKWPEPCPSSVAELRMPLWDVGNPPEASTTRTLRNNTSQMSFLLNNARLPRLLQSLSNVSILVYGCSLDRFMLDWLCNARGGSMRKWNNSSSSSHEKVAKCVDVKDNVEIAYVFNPGAGKPPYFANVTKPDLEYWARRILAREPSVVVVDDSLWELSKWSEQGYFAEQMLGLWCDKEVPKLLQDIRGTFVNSRVVVRTAPTVAGILNGANPVVLEAMTACLWKRAVPVPGYSQGQSWKVDGVIPLHEIVDEAIAQALVKVASSSVSSNWKDEVWLNDGRHLTSNVNKLYATAMLLWVSGDLMAIGPPMKSPVNWAPPHGFTPPMLLRSNVAMPSRDIHDDSLHGRWTIL